MHAHLVATYITMYLGQLIQELLHPVSNHLMNCLWIQSPVKYSDLLQYIIDKPSYCDHM